MNRDVKKPDAWTKPELIRLGEIKDVAGNSGTGGQQGNGKAS